MGQKREKEGKKKKEKKKEKKEGEKSSFFQGKPFILTVMSIVYKYHVLLGHVTLKYMHINVPTE